MRAPGMVVTAPAGNSEASFNSAVFTSGLSVKITNIQVLDDVSSIGAVTVPTNLLSPPSTMVLENDGEAQGGVINMANFAGLVPLNQPYALLAEDLGPVTTYSTSTGGGIGATVPFGLPYTVAEHSTRRTLVTC